MQIQSYMSILPIRKRVKKANAILHRLCITTYRRRWRGGGREEKEGNRHLSKSVGGK